MDQVFKGASGTEYTVEKVLQDRGPPYDRVLLARYALDLDDVRGASRVILQGGQALRGRYIGVKGYTQVLLSTGWESKRPGKRQEWAGGPWGPEHEGACSAEGHAS
jgi:hypothetical protein